MTNIIIQRISRQGSEYPTGSEWANSFCYEAAISFQEINFWDKKTTFKLHGYVFDEFYPNVSCTANKEIIYVGSIPFIKKVAGKLGFQMPSPINIPKSIEKYAGREITYGTIKDVKSYPIFIKPADELKLFPGGVITREPSLTIPELKEDTKLLISEVVDFVTEYRCFVLRGKLVAVKHYGGNFKYYPDIAIVESCISEYVDAPCAYCIDFGVTSDGVTKLIEVNDFWSCGTYGFTGQDYAYMLVSRWREIIKQAGI